MGIPDIFQILLGYKTFLSLNLGTWGPEKKLLTNMGRIEWILEERVDITGGVYKVWEHLEGVVMIVVIY